MAEGLLEQRLLCGGASLAAEGVVDCGDVGEGEWGWGLLALQDLFRAGTEVAVVAENGREPVWIFFGDGGDRPQEDSEADGEHALFAAGEDPATKIESG